MPKGLRGFQKDNKINLGRKHTKEAKRKIGECQRGEKNWNWRGGKIIHTAGYIYLLQSNHPFCNMQGYVRRSHLVMEKHLGRYLTPKEKMHHINKIVDDDRIENLMLFATNSEHSKFHWRGRAKLDTLSKQ